MHRPEGRGRWRDSPGVLTPASEVRFTAPVMCDARIRLERPALVAETLTLAYRSAR